MNDQEKAELQQLQSELAEISRRLGAITGGSLVDKTLFYAERRHFESLLKDRISLQLVFSTLLLFAAYQGVDAASHLAIPHIGAISLRRLFLIVGAIVSLALLQAIFRTYQFAQASLKTLCRKWPEDPYTAYRPGVWLWNANHSLLFASIVLTLLFCLLTVFGVDIGWSPIVVCG